MRIRIQEGKWMRIHADPDPQPCTDANRPGPDQDLDQDLDGHKNVGIIYWKITLVLPFVLLTGIYVVQPQHA